MRNSWSGGDEMAKSSAIGMGPQRLERPSQKEMLTEKKRALEAELARVNAALTALEEHPEIERVMTLVSQALY